jgi:hypothetical protein
MLARRAATLALLVAVFACAGRESVAGKLLGPSVSIRNTPVRFVRLPGLPAQAGPVCQLGEHGAPFSTLDIINIQGGDDPYYTWVAAESCAACNNTNHADIVASNIALYFPAAPETVTVTTSIVGVNRINCRYEDPTLVLCPGTTQKLICAAGDQLTTQYFAMPLGTCHLDLPPDSDGQGFLLIDFVALSDTAQAHRPQLATQAAGYLCRTWNDLQTFRTDVVAGYGSGNPIMYVDVDACITDEVKRQSWGQLKTIYR